MLALDSHLKHYYRPSMETHDCTDSTLEAETELQCHFKFETSPGFIENIRLARAMKVGLGSTKTKPNQTRKLGSGGTHL